MRFGRKNPAEPTSELWKAVAAAMADARGYANSHGGDIQLVEVTEDGTVRVKFRGACSFCPLATVTLKLVVEKRLMELVPEIRRVVSA